MDSSNIKVFTRLRPSDSGSDVCIAVRDNLAIETVGNIKAQQQGQSFTYDRVFTGEATQEDVFEVCGMPLVDEVVKGFNCTLFAYGQTGSGKSYTIFGPEPGQDSECTEEELKGLLPRILEKLFAKLLVATRDTTKEAQFLCKGALLEIYNEKIHDLLDAAAENLQLRESMSKGVYVENQTEVVFETAEEALEVIKRGAEGRRIGATAMNRESSRSHTVFTLTVESKSLDADKVLISRTSRFNIVDLAGSERQKLTKATGERQKEANFINRSLLCLGTVISTLSSFNDIGERGCRPHIKYRDSKLTFLLRDSLGGNSKTHMIANINPLTQYFAESLNTLKFAQRAKLIKNNAKINQDLADANVALLKAQIMRLKEQLAVKVELVSNENHPGETVPNDEHERIEQLLTHSLMATQTARKRADTLTELLKSKDGHCSKLQKALNNQKALFKMKDAVAKHLMKQKVDPELFQDWQAKEAKFQSTIMEQNIETVTWRAKYEEVSAQSKLHEEQLRLWKDLEDANRKLSEETRILLEQKRQLQDRIHATPVYEEETPTETLVDEDPVTPQKSRPRTSYGTPVRVPLLTGSSKKKRSTRRICPTPSRADFEELEQEFLERKHVGTSTDTNSFPPPDDPAEVKKLQEQLLTIECQISELRHELSSEQDANEKLRLAEEVSNREYLALQAQFNLTTEQLLEQRKLQEDLDTALATNELNEQRLEALSKKTDEEKEGLQNALSEALRTVEYFRNCRNEQNQAEKAQEQQNQELQDEMHSLTELLQAQQRTDELRIKKLKSDVQERTQQAQKFESQVRSLESLVGQLKANLQKERRRAEELSAENQAHLSDKSELEASLSDVREDAETLRVNLEEAKVELFQVHESQRARERQLVAELASQKGQSMIDKKKNNAEKEIAMRIEAENKTLELEMKVEELSAANAKLAGNKNSKERIKYVQGLRDQIAELRDTETRLRKRIATLESKENTPLNKFT
uniref:Kinesin-like protein n=1 Tax=Mucochytrium quahogii TaxID=96639 RepID=A0A7S2WNF6_9STRA|mmetsp:Transcript_5409/g.12035  ORF Transcript_5409/g.12035 Transcript_5409/m.12035 type:complete len:984 (+) Transcript_5409:515-3466(+)